MIQVAKDPRFGNTKAMLLFETPQDALKAIEGGVEIKELNIGSMAHSIGKVVVNKAIAMDKDDVKTIEKIKSKGTSLIFVRCQLIQKKISTIFLKRQKPN